MTGRGRPDSPCDSVEVEYEDGALYIRLRSGHPAFQRQYTLSPIVNKVPGEFIVDFDIESAPLGIEILTPWDDPPLPRMLEQLGLLECLPEVHAALRAQVPQDVLAELPRLMATPHDQ